MLDPEEGATVLDPELYPATEDTPPEPEPQLTPEETIAKLENDRKADLGRLNKEQEKIARTREQLTGSGYTTDDEGNLITDPATQRYQQPAPKPEPEVELLFDTETDAGIQKRIQAGVDAGMQRIMGQITPILNQVVSSSVIGPQHPDWKEIAPEVEATLKQMGYLGGVAQAMQMNPAMLDVAINAARGKRGVVAPTPPTLGTQDTEAARQAALGSAGRIGGSGGSGLPTRSDLDPAVLAEGKRQGLTEEQTIALVTGPAKIAIKED
jgi:hypothetical protein